jgi:ubiquinone/menaquinone biosynthesis C-methylase UbiE
MIMNSLDVLLQKNSLFSKYRTWWADKAVRECWGEFSDTLVGKRALEIGCGSGCGTAVIKKYFADVELTATDLDSRLLAAAAAKLSDSSITFAVADACRLECADNEYDAIFDFGVIHHIADWRACLRELRRALKPDGTIFVVDSPIESFNTFVGRIVRTYASHPYDEMFSEHEFVEYLGELGFTTLVRHTYSPTLYYFVMLVRK